MKNLMLKVLVGLSLLLSQCAFQAEEIIELPKGEPTLAVYVDLSNANGFTAYVVKKRSATEPVEWDFNLYDSIVDIKTGKTVFKRQGFSYSPGNDTLFDYVKDAKVKIYEEGKFISELKQEYRPLPLYVDLDKTVTSGKKYQVEVTAPGYPTVTGEQVAVSDINTESITFNKNSFQSDKGLLSEIIVRIKDPKDEINSYFIVANLKTINIKTNKEEFYNIPIYKTDPASSNNSIISDRTFNGQTYSWRVGADTQRFLSDTKDKEISLTVLVFPINNDLEKFVRTLEAREANLDNPFTEPTTPFYNLKGGVGIFSITGQYTLKGFKIQ
jgi:hypothetical protein